MEDNKNKQEIDLSKVTIVTPAIKPLGEMDTATNPNTGNEINIKDVRERIDVARGNVHAVNPCFGALLEYINFIYTFDVPTQATDGTRLFINPEWTQTLTDGEIRFVMIHELLHCVFCHMKRGMGHDKRIANIAADYEVNGAAYIDKFVNMGQLDHIGAYYLEKYTKHSETGEQDLWSYEMIYDDVINNPNLKLAPPELKDIIWPKSKGNGNTTRVPSSNEFKNGAADAMHKINEILEKNYRKMSKKLGDSYTKDDVAHTLQNAMLDIIKIRKSQTHQAQPNTQTAIPQAMCFMSNNNYDDFNESTDIMDEYRTYEQGWDFAVDLSLKHITNLIAIINGTTGGDGGSSESEQNVFPSLRSDTEQLNIPYPPQYVLELNAGKGGTGDKEKKLSNEDIISQQEGANIARKAGYSGEFTKEEEMDDIESKWEELTHQMAGKEGSELITRRLKDVEASRYNWEHELRKLMNRAMSNSLRFRNEWGEKRGLARDTMTLKHKTNNDSIKDVVFLVDCSGSISDKTLSNLLAECYSISTKCRVYDVTYAYFTTRVELVETTNSRLAGKISDAAVMLLKRTDKHARGGHITGGTDFKNALDWVNENGGARCVVLFTDGYDEVVPKPHNVKNLIWCVYDNPNFKSADNSRVVYMTTKNYQE